jgi:hypothetical protein
MPLIQYDKGVRDATAWKVRSIDTRNSGSRLFLKSTGKDSGDKR